VIEANLRSQSMQHRVVGFVLSLALCALAACQTYTLKNPYIPDKSTDSTGPQYRHNVSQVKYWDRISTVDQATGFAWWDSMGATHELGEYWNKVVVLNFFGTWSPPCLAQLEVIRKLRMELADTSVVFIGVTQREAVSAGKAVLYIDSFAQAKSIPYQLLIGTRDFGFTYGGIDVVPTTFVINSRRKITATFEGEVPATALSAAIAKAKGQ
jgi:thiol-disulfide isomerase/thioredoxin